MKLPVSVKMARLTAITMFSRPIVLIAFTSFVVSLTLLLGIMTNENVKASLFGTPVPVVEGFLVTSLVQVDVSQGTELTDSSFQTKEGSWSFCDYQMPETPTFSVELSNSRIDEGIQGGETFSVDFTFKNTGNSRLFSADSQCAELPVFNLGTQLPQDRESVFSKEAPAGWVSSNRIQMAESYVEPGESFTVSFQSVAPEGDNLYREFFQPVVENVGWIGNSFGIDIEVGTPTDEMRDNMQYVSSLSIDAASLTGLEKNILVDLSEQKLYARFGEHAVWAMPTSTGASDTPTPTGSYRIFQKQDLRVGGEPYYYRMPWWQFWDDRGYGIHALPYIGTSEGGYYWEEALDHIGRPVSHGCIRTLPEDAEKLYRFTVIGTPVVIQR